MYIFANETTNIPASMLFHHQILEFIIDSFSEVSKKTTINGEDFYPTACYLSEMAFKKLTSGRKAKRISDTEILWLPDHDLNPFCVVRYSTEEINGKTFYNITYIRVGIVHTRFFDTSPAKIFFKLEDEEVSFI